jgi:methylenetetrahydrofolate reductase (NADPH)
VRVGLAGPANVRALLKFALYCGVGPSMRALGTHATTIGRLLATGGPEAVMRDLAAADVFGAAGGITGLHFFPFGGVARTARMIRAVSDGQFHVVHGKKGFEVDAGK